MGHFESVWRAFEKFAILFSFAVTFVLVLVLLLLGIGLWQVAPSLPGLRDGTLCPLLARVDSLVNDFDTAVINKTIYISQTIPVEFDLPLNQNTAVKLTQSVPLNRSATFVLPGGGGRINGTVSLALPDGMDLPVKLNLTVPVRQNLPISMEVPVSIPLKETDLGSVTGELKDILTPYTKLLSDLLHCPKPSP
ncbi:MAG: hypothetical protein JXM73_18410 [Anaerolineae bacterium]|nr:hypothetical protein [Anaerolineae bacterium]